MGIVIIVLCCTKKVECNNCVFHDFVIAFSVKINLVLKAHFFHNYLAIIRNVTNIYTEYDNNVVVVFTIIFCFSSPIWFHHHFCGCLSIGSFICPPQQLGWDQVWIKGINCISLTFIALFLQTWCPEVCLWDPAGCGREGGEYWDLV